MFNFFKPNYKRNCIKRWTNQVSSLINVNQELSLKIDQVGILDGHKIVLEYLEYNEYQLAYDHLIYMIQESAIHLSENDLNEIANFSSVVGANRPDLLSPTIIEIEEFFRILDMFNTSQKRAVDSLTQTWKMKVPIKREEWISWSHDQYQDDQFQNDLGIEIHPHGFGLSYLDSEGYIDFDFGENGEISGFDVSRIWRFIEQNEISVLFRNEKQIQNVVNFEVKKGELEFSGYLNYYKKPPLRL